ncbi:murein biosynthesis integral membrane protein MurJ [Auraticoccus sp. F435]|uniref:Murein biosynthesis integral membrane protein MurJ n=1 Tax=Auraticoccus cholistanensis TaxID=2656650 RepID=A0A6A9UZW9_9ACTN|nr:murein biosynthesis integral membrane protein MurJ [Auraticoccus cholistanensis]MVA74569.1 murein biosynthesis integral membrane protein MurJ [Auraticoccus cholistanensis]
MSVDTRSSSLVSAGALMAAGTLLSRVLGFARAVVIAMVLGNTTRQADMFTLANTIPTSLYILFAGGALNTVLVPQIVRATSSDEDGGEAYTNRIMTAFLAIIAGVTVVLLLAAPLVLRIYTDAGWRDPELSEQYRSMLTLTYLCLPQVFFYGAFFLAGQVLNARGRFGPMMWAPIANNVVSIAVFVGYLLVFGTDVDHGAPFSTAQELVLGLGATAGILVQAAILLPFLRRAGFVYRPRFDLRGTGLGRTFSLAKWTLGFVAVTQLALVAVNRLASSATAGAENGGGLTVYNNAYLVWILPHSVITVSLATAMVTSASKLAADGDLGGVSRETARTIRLTTTVLLPAAVAFLVLATPIARLAFGYGVGASDYPVLALALQAFALGLVPFTIHYVLLRAFYALEDTRTPFLLQALIAGLNAGFAVLLVRLVADPSLVATALALAYSLSYAVGVVVAFRRLQSSLPGLSARAVGRHLVRVTLAVLPAAGLAWLITWLQHRLTEGRVASALGLALAGVVAVGAYVAAARLLHLREMDEIVGTVLRRRRGVAGSDDSAPVEGAAPAGDPAAAPGREGDAVQGSAGEERPSAPGPEHAELETQPMSALGPDGHPLDPAAAAEEAPQDAWRGSSRPSPEEEMGSGVLATPSTDPDVLRRSRQRAGDVLGRRYRLEEVVAGRADAHTWRAFDQVLSRSVLVQVLPPDDPRSPALLEAARASAVATDSRFLRVLDAVESNDPEVGSYIVTEFSPGQTLEVMLAQGPLSALEAAWLVREVADALAGMHAMGLHHRHLGPDAITITPAGNLKITGFLLEAAIVPDDADEPDGGEILEAGSSADDPTVTLPVRRTDDPEAQDVRDLGRLLYAALVSRWPGAARYGLDRAPTDGGRLLTPRQVRHGVSPALDRITDRILSPVPRHHEEPLRTAAEVAQALSTVLGTADASHDLERRVRQPVPVVGSGPATVAMSPAASPVSAVAPDPVRPPVSALTPEAEAAPPTVRVVDPTQPVRRRWLGVLVALLLLALVVGLIGVFVQNQARFTGNAPGDQASTDTAPQPVEVADVLVFDPQGDVPNDENNDLAPLAVDGDPETAWQTLAYRGNPELGGLKRGVGLVLDLGEATEVSRLDVVLPEDPTAVQVLAPADRAAAEAPMTSDADWEVLAEDEEAAGEAGFELTEPVTTRYLLLYLTELPPEGSSYRGYVYEVEVQG